MGIYMQSTLELKADGVERFTETMKQIVEFVEGQGWHLVTAIMQMSGRLHTAVDLWELDDMNHYVRALGVLREDPRFPAMAQVLADTIERETVVFGSKAAWVPERT